MKKLWFAILPALVIATSLFAQTELANVDMSSGPQFHLDYAAIAAPGDSTQARLFLYFEIKNDGLQFVKLEDGYEANYEISIALFDEDNYQVTGKILKKTLFVDNYEETNSRVDYTLTEDYFDVQPGKYKIMIALEDAETGRTSKSELKIKVENFLRQELTISDIIFSDSLKTNEGGERWLSPTISDSRKGFNKTINAYFELYNNKDTEQAVEIKYELNGNSTRFRFQEQYRKTLSAFRQGEIIRIPADSLAADEYRLRITVNGAKKGEIEKNFFVRWRGLPETAKDVDTAVAQLQYIASSPEWKKFKNAEGAKKMEVFKEFWQKRDPTPGTEVNEAMEGHYNRIDYANRTFSVMQRDGWRTDMGMVYVILGAPDEVERNVFPRFSNYPYEIWHYYRYNRYFEFYDATGFGDYRLASPSSFYELQALIGR